MKMQTGESFESFAALLTLVFLLHPGTLGAPDQVVGCHLAGVDEVVAERAVVLGWVIVHLEVIVQAGLAVECPAAELTPPPAAL